MSKTIFNLLTGLMAVSLYQFQWKIGDDGVETATGCQTYSSLKEEAMAAKTICG